MTPQHLTALARANQIRLARADLKRDVRSGDVDVADVILDPPECAETMRVHELLRARHRVGTLKASTLLQRAGIHESKTLGAMTDRQRHALVAGLLPAAERSAA